MYCLFNIHINIKNIIYKILDNKDKIRFLYNTLNKLRTFNSLCY